MIGRPPAFVAYGNQRLRTLLLSEFPKPRFLTVPASFLHGKIHTSQAQLDPVLAASMRDNRKERGHFDGNHFPTVLQWPLFCPVIRSNTLQAMPVASYPSRPVAWAIENIW